MSTRGGGLLALVMISFIFARNVGGPFPSLLFYLTASTLLLALLWTAALSRGLIATVEIRGREFTVGDSAEVILHVCNRTPLPVSLYLSGDTVDLPGTVTLFPGGEGVGIAPFHRRAFRRWIRLERRGRFRPNPLLLRFGDPADLFRVTRRLGAETSFSVYPRAIRVRVPLPRTHSPSGRLRAGTPVGKNLTDLSHVRPLVPGDSLRHIHWKVSAHRGALHVKEFEPYGTAPMTILLDMNPQVHAGRGDSSTDEFAAALALGLARQALSRGRPVGLLSSGRNPVRIPPALGVLQEHRLRESLLDIRPDARLPFPRWLASQQAGLPAENSLFLITPEASTRLAEALFRLQRAGHDLFLLAVRPGSFLSGRDREPERDVFLTRLRRGNIPCISLTAGQREVKGWEP